MPTTHYSMLCGNVWKEAHCPLTPAVRQCTKGNPPRTCPPQCTGVLVISKRPAAHCTLYNVLQDTHYPLPPVVKRCTGGYPQPTAPCSAAVYCRIAIAHCPLQCGSVLKETHGLLPLVVWQGTEGEPLPSVVWCDVVQCSAVQGGLV